MSAKAVKSDDVKEERSSREILIDNIHEKLSTKNPSYALGGVRAVDGVYVTCMSIERGKEWKDIDNSVIVRMDFDNSYQHAIVIPETDDLKKDISNALEKIPTIKYDKATEFWVKRYPRYQYLNKSKITYESLGDCENINFGFGECVVCYDTTSTQVNCCEKFLCRQCAGKIKLAIFFKCPHCRETASFKSEYSDSDDDE